MSYGLSSCHSGHNPHLSLSWVPPTAYHLPCAFRGRGLPRLSDMVRMPLGNDAGDSSHAPNPRHIVRAVKRSRARRPQIPHIPQSLVAPCRYTPYRKGAPQFMQYFRLNHATGTR